MLNQRYPRKRALYLAGLAQHLASSSDIGTMRYSCLHGNRLRPVLLLTPPGSYVMSNGFNNQEFFSWLELYFTVMLFWLYCSSLFLGVSVLGKESSSFSVRVHVCPPPGFFKPSRFHPQKNNIRTNWYTGTQTPLSGKIIICFSFLSLFIYIKPAMGCDRQSHLPVGHKHSRHHRLGVLTHLEKGKVV